MMTEMMSSITPLSLLGALLFVSTIPAARYLGAFEARVDFIS
jgi:hypothetical protein